ncbi:MAG: hypothetical protein R3C97_13930 [Geminicoccaceae bacterium]
MKLSRRALGAFFARSHVLDRHRSGAGRGQDRRYQFTRLPAHTEPYRMGAELAIEEINARGGAGGRCSNW